ncbi:MAG: PEP-CTERM sorting domain-containing protein [Planctomycetales bacterium]|nr:PEP-CTERM sorting domain-containing protein [Planctomycetales bacterium]
MILLPTLASAAEHQPLAKLWSDEAHFEVQPEAIGTPSDHMHFLSMFWDADPVDTPGEPHFKAYYIGGPGFSTRLARSTDGVNFADAGTVLGIGAAGAWDDRIASFSSVWKDADTYYLVYEGAGQDTAWPGDIALATSSDGVNFTKQGRILTHRAGTYEKANIGTPSLHKEGDTWYLYYHGFDGTDVQIGLATGSDLATDMTRVQATPIIPTSAADWDSGTAGKRSRLIKEGDYYYMAYEGSTDQPFDRASWSTGIARSLDLLHWEKLPQNPVIPATGGGFGYDGPEMLYVGDDLYIYYRTGANQTARAKLVWDAVPEPSGLCLLTVGGTAVLAFRRRRRS